MDQRRLAENDALVELIQTTEYLDGVPIWGQWDYRLYPPHYGDPFYRGRGRGRGRGGRGRRELLQERQVDRPNGGFARGNGRAALERPQNKSLQIDPNQSDKRMNGLYLLILREEMMQKDAKQHKHLPQLPLLLQRKDYLLIGAVKVLQEKELVNKFSKLEVLNQEEQNK